MSHGSYIALSYAAAALLIGGLTLYIWLAGRIRRREIARLEAEGVRRRSATARKKSVRVDE